MAFLAPMYAAMGVGATAATTAGVMGTAATTAMIGSSFVPMAMTTAGALGTTGGLMAGISGAFSAIQPYGSLISSALSGMQSIRQGDIMKSQYELQSLQTLTEMERQQYNATVEGAARLDKLQRIQSANLANNYARGVSGLSGSALLNQIVSDQEYGKDYKMELYNIANIGTSGRVNSDIYKASAKAAPIDAALDAGIKLGEAAYSYKKLYG
jgi:hypothetical protein